VPTLTNCECDSILLSACPNWPLARPLGPGVPSNTWRVPQEETVRAVVYAMPRCMRLLRIKGLVAVVCCMRVARYGWLLPRVSCGGHGSSQVRAYPFRWLERLSARLSLNHSLMSKRLSAACHQVLRTPEDHQRLSIGRTADVCRAVSYHDVVSCFMF
jgi:hypothetical protein